MRLTDVPLTTARDLLTRYEGVLLDASGVLLTHEGPIPGAPAFVTHLARAERPFAVLSNDASRTPETLAARLSACGLPVSADRVITTGALLPGWFAQAGLQNPRCAVLGPEDAFVMVRRAGGQASPPSADAPLDVLVVADEAGYPFVEWIDTALTQVTRAVRQGRRVRVVVPNPDVVYVRGPDSVGFTAGAIAALLRAALERLLGPDCPAFASLGKPGPALFRAGLARLGSRRVVMIGDQLATDIAGARAAGIDAALVGTGLTDVHAPVPITPENAPTWRIQSLRMDAAKP